MIVIGLVVATIVGQQSAFVRFCPAQTVKLSIRSRSSYPPELTVPRGTILVFSGDVIGNGERKFGIRSGVRRLGMTAFRNQWSLRWDTSDENEQNVEVALVAQEGSGPLTTFGSLRLHLLQNNPLRLNCEVNQATGTASVTAVSEVPLQGLKTEILVDGTLVATAEDQRPVTVEALKLPPGNRKLSGRAILPSGVSFLVPDVSVEVPALARLVLTEGDPKVTLDEQHTDATYHLKLTSLDGKPSAGKELWCNGFKLFDLADGTPLDIRASQIPWGKDGLRILTNLGDGNQVFSDELPVEVAITPSFAFVTRARRLVSQVDAGLPLLLRALYIVHGVREPAEKESLFTYEGKIVEQTRKGFDESKLLPTNGWAKLEQIVKDVAHGFDGTPLQGLPPLEANQCQDLMDAYSDFLLWADGLGRHKVSSKYFTFLSDPFDGAILSSKGAAERLDDGKRLTVASKTLKLIETRRSAIAKKIGWKDQTFIDRFGNVRHHWQAVSLPGIAFQQWLAGVHKICCVLGTGSTFIIKGKDDIKELTKIVSQDTFRSTQRRLATFQVIQSWDEIGYSNEYGLSGDKGEDLNNLSRLLGGIMGHFGDVAALWDDYRQDEAQLAQLREERPASQADILAKASRADVIRSDMQAILAKIDRLARDLLVEIDGARKKLESEAADIL